jgi:hypothetical protein
VCLDAVLSVCLRGVQHQQIERNVGGRQRAEMQVDPVRETREPLVKLAQGPLPDHSVGFETWGPDRALKRLNDGLSFDAKDAVGTIIPAQCRNRHLEAEIYQCHLHEMDMSASRPAPQSGVAFELLYGPAANSNQRTLTLESLRATVDAARRTTVDLDAVVRQAESGDGIAGALLNGDGRRFDANLQETAASARAATATLDELAIRYRNADGAIPQLMENREYAREVMGNLRQSSADLEQILHKINTGQGTIGKLVNNPGLYDSAQKLVATQGWGVAFMKAVYDIFHPLSSTEPGAAAEWSRRRP